MMAQNPVVLTATLPAAKAWPPPTSVPMSAYCAFDGVTPCLKSRSPAHCSASTTSSLSAVGLPSASMIAPPFWYARLHHTGHQPAPPYPQVLPFSVSSLNASRVSSQVDSAVGALMPFFSNRVLL